MNIEDMQISVGTDTNIAPYNNKSRENPSRKYQVIET